MYTEGNLNIQNGGIYWLIGSQNFYFPLVVRNVKYLSDVKIFLHVILSSTRNILFCSRIIFQLMLLVNSAPFNCVYDS